MNKKMQMMLESFGPTEGAEHFDPWWLLVALLASLAASLVASWLYAVFYERRGTGSQINRAFPLLGISITTLFVSVQVSLPLSLGLLGALSIVRFRTPVKEPEEVGFIMLVIAAAITCATFRFEFLLILYGVAIFALVVFRSRVFFKQNARDGMLIIAMQDDAANELLDPLNAQVRDATRTCNIESCTSREGVTSVQYSYSGLKGSLAEFRTALTSDSRIQTVNFLMNRPGNVT
ncbi:MAG: DUF4956 domain-containing protein [Kiritimatiellia bacterium]|jgi:hypothetical protein|nr:DUF4956 domain-containing protein [Kiritimatiellia bacterium]MDP7024493.1 DUF4956 domain-containing protein [Kiritimatiellia bacterium]